MIAVAELRVERDLIGARELPATARYGVHAARAAENFARPRAELVRDVPELSRAFGLVKLAALQANVASGLIATDVAGALETACRELIEDADDLRAGLVVPLVQGGAGTSTNMNVNEVLANRALELMGFAPGTYERCHPNDDVNRSQSTNDVYPTALRLALLLRSSTLERAAADLTDALRERADRFAQVPKLGRTQLQDAVPMTVGDEFHAWADAIGAAREGIVASRGALLEVNLGGTAIGTGLAACADYRTQVVARLADVSGMPLRRAARPVSATTDVAGLLGHSAALRTAAVALAKVANDLRLLSSGPQAGLAELRIPAVQAGSSMMPGKVNPVIPEFVNQLAFRVRGADAVVVAALDAGQLQLHAMLPVVASALLGAQADLRCACEALATRCVEGIAVDRRRTAEYATHGLGELSELAASRGYALATRAALAQQTASEHAVTNATERGE